MKYAIQAKTTEAAHRLTTAEERKQIVSDAIKKAEKLNLGAEDAGIFDGPYGLKIVVHWGTKTVHIMTATEANAAGLPKSGEQN